MQEGQINRFLSPPAPRSCTNCAVQQQAPASTAPTTETTAKVEPRSTDESGHLLTPRAAATRNAGTEIFMLLLVTEEALGTSRSR